MRHFINGGYPLLIDVTHPRSQVAKRCFALQKNSIVFWSAKQRFATMVCEQECVTSVINGQRDLNTRQIHALSNRFHVLQIRKFVAKF